MTELIMQPEIPQKKRGRGRPKKNITPEQIEACNLKKLACHNIRQIRYREREKIKMDNMIFIYNTLQIKFPDLFSYIMTTK